MHGKSPLGGLVCDTMVEHRGRRADRAPGRCRAGGSSLGGKDPTGRFALQLNSWKPALTAVNRGSGLDPGPGTGGRMLPTGLASEITGGGYFPAGPRDQAGEDSDVDALPKEMHRAIGKGAVSAAAVKAVDLAVIGA